MSAEFAQCAGPAGTALSFERRPAMPLGAQDLLGARLLVAQAPHRARQPESLPLPLLAPTGSVEDAWLSSGQVMRGQRGAVRYATDGHWLHGDVTYPTGRGGSALEVAAQQAYVELFALLDTLRCAHPLRLWNYVPGINDEGDGLENYRHFNVGRQKAYIAAGRSAFAGAPAACALGSRGDALSVHVLAGRQASHPIENPRQVSAYDYPKAYGPRSPSFSRAAVAEIGGGRQALFISGTASIIGHFSVHIGDVPRQTEETLVNIEAILQQASGHLRGALSAAMLSYTVYLRRREDLAAVRETFEAHVGPASMAARTAVYLEADICRADLLVEIEAHGITAAAAG